MGKERDLAENLRYRILGLLHAGRLQPGDRLPSIRRLSEQEQVDHRVVARAYRALADEGLVDVRQGSGIYVASLGPRDGVRTETVAWLTDLLLEGWRRRIPRSEVGELVARSATRLRCACVESNQDHMTALCSEIEADFSLDVTQVEVSPDGNATLDPERIQGVDLVATSVFHAESVRAAAARVRLPAVVLTFDQDFTAEIDRRLSETTITTVVADPNFVARAEAYLAVTRHQGRVRYVLAEHVEAERVDIDGPDVLVTRAARRLLGMEDFHLLPPPHRVVSVHSARELSRAVVGLALQGLMAETPASSR